LLAHLFGDAPEGKWYYAEFMDIPGAEAAGKTLKELKKDAQRVLSLILQDFLDDGNNVPAPSPAEGKGIIWVEPLPEIQHRLDHPEENTPVPISSELETVLKQLHSEDLNARRKAVCDLHHSWRRKAREAMVAMCADRDTKTQCFAMSGLLHQVVKEAAPVIRELLGDPRIDMRRYAAYVLSSLDPAAGPDILPLLNDPSEHVRISAIMYLADPDYKPALYEIRALLNDPDPSVRAASYWAVGKFRDRASESPLLKAIEENDTNIRFEAACALLELSNPQGRTALEDILAKKVSPDFIKRDSFLKTVRRIIAASDTRLKEHGVK
jgi:predicted RNase H-like HicB family nuclease